MDTTSPTLPTNRRASQHEGLIVPRVRGPWDFKFVSDDIEQAYQLAATEHEFLYAMRPLLTLDFLFGVNWGMGVHGNQKLVTTNVVVIPPLMILGVNIIMLVAR